MKNSESALKTLIWQALELYPTEKLGQFIFDKNKKVRYAAARRLQLCGGHFAFSLATQLINSKKSSDRLMGVFILGQLNPPTFPFKEQSIPLIVSTLRSDKSRRVQCESIVSLGHLHAESALDEIIKHSNDKNNKVRAAVAAALSMFPRTNKTTKALNFLKNDTSSLVRYWASD